MRTAETILTVVNERGQRGLPLEGVYRLLFQRDLNLQDATMALHSLITITGEPDAMKVARPVRRGGGGKVLMDHE